MRRELDAYFTPAHLTKALISRYPWLSHVRVTEPCAGDGAIARHIVGCKTYDVDERYGHDVADARTARFPPTDAFVTNPPFTHALEILENLRSQAPFVALLMRVSFLEPTRARSAYLAANPPDMLIVCPRVSFTGDGKTDSVTCAWMVWGGPLRGVAVEGRDAA